MSDAPDRALDLLLLEDNRGDARLLEEALKLWPRRHRLHVLTDGAEALAYLRGAGGNGAPRPDLVLLDLNLPGKTGGEVLVEMRNDPALRALPTVILTSSQAEADRARARALRADGFFTKPARVEQYADLLATIEVLIQQRDAAPAAAAGPERAPAQTRLRVLLVEDNAGYARLIRELLLEDLQTIATVQVAASLAQALEMTEACDIALVDLNLPDSVSRDTFDAIQRRAPALPIVVLTGFNDEAMAFWAVQAGAQDYLVKGSVERSQGVLSRALRYAVERKRIMCEKDRLIRELQDALAKVKTLSGLLPICASCKRVRSDQGYWQQVETYVQEHSNAMFSHGVCPECARRLYPSLFQDDPSGRRWFGDRLQANADKSG